MLSLPRQACQCISGLCAHRGLAADKLQESEYQQRLQEQKAVRCGSNPVFLKGSFMPPTPARGRAVWQGSDEPVSTGAGPARKELAWEPVGSPLWVSPVAPGGKKFSQLVKQSPRIRGSGVLGGNERHFLCCSRHSWPTAKPPIECGCLCCY